MYTCDDCGKEFKKSELVFVCQRRPSSPDTLTCVMAFCFSCGHREPVEGTPSCDAVSTRTSSEWARYEESDQMEKDKIIFFEIF